MTGFEGFFAVLGGLSLHFCFLLYRFHYLSKFITQPLKPPIYASPPVVNIDHLAYQFWLDHLQVIDFEMTPGLH